MSLVKASVTTSRRACKAGQLMKGSLDYRLLTIFTLISIHSYTRLAFYMYIMYADVCVCVQPLDIEIITNPYILSIVFCIC